MSNFTSPAQSINGLYLKALNALIGELSTTEFRVFDKEAFAKAHGVDVLLIDVLVDMGFLIEGPDDCKYPQYKADKSLYNVGPEPAMAWVERAKAELAEKPKDGITWFSPVEERQMEIDSIRELTRATKELNAVQAERTDLHNKIIDAFAMEPKEQVKDTGYLVVTPTDSFLADSYDEAVSVGQKHSRADDVIIEIFKRVATVECVQSFKVTPC